METDPHEHYDEEDADISQILANGTKAIAASTNKLLTSKFRGVSSGK